MTHQTAAKAWRRVSAWRGAVDIIVTMDIVSSPPRHEFPGELVLINPANKSLSGTALSYFPRGGPCPEPVPKDLGSGTWGGMEAGPNMLYPTQCVDGRVTAEGGRELRRALAQTAACPVGGAVRTEAYHHLLDMGFRRIVHTVAPFHSDVDWANQLKKTYHSALTLAVGGNPRESERGVNILLPLLGAGACGAPVAEAARVGAEAVAEVVDAGKLNGAHLSWVVQEARIAEDLQARLDEAFGMGNRPLPR
jgi:O-acetyl-ADP-ribose deacetylase (regulator of RNase III)